MTEMSLRRIVRNKVHKHVYTVYRISDNDLDAGTRFFKENVCNLVSKCGSCFGYLYLMRGN